MKHKPLVIYELRLTIDDLQKLASRRLGKCGAVATGEGGTARKTNEKAEWGSEAETQGDFRVTIFDFRFGKFARCHFRPKKTHGKRVQ